MRTIEEVRRVQALVKEGLNDCEIARRTGIPRGTVRDWRHGKVPRRGPNGLRIPAENSCPTCGHPLHDFDALPSKVYSYLLGLYLGDGTITRHARHVYRLGITLDRKYPGIVRECAHAMSVVMPSSKVGIQHCKNMQADFVNSYSRAWPCLFPQHGPGRKHRREIPRYFFSNRSGDIKRIFCDACDSLGIEWRPTNAKDISIARHESVALMDEFVGPKE